MAIKLVRKWENSKFEFGQDMQANIYCKCKSCNKTGLILREFDFKTKEIVLHARCAECNIKLRLT